MIRGELVAGPFDGIRIPLGPASSLMELPVVLIANGEIYVIKRLNPESAIAFYDYRGGKDE